MKKKPPVLVDFDADPPFSAIATLLGFIITGVALFFVAIIFPWLWLLFLGAPVSWTVYKIVSYAIDYYNWQNSNEEA